MTQILLLVTVAAALQSESDRLIQRHLQWLGGAEALSRVQSLSWSGTMKSWGLQGSITVHQSRAGWWRQDRDLGAISDSAVVGPAGSWSRTFNGQVEPLGTGAAERERRDGGRALGRHLLDPAWARREDRGSEARAGRRWRVLRWSFADGDYFELFLDPASGSCTWLRERKDTQLTWRRLDSWRTVAGVRLPFSEAFLHDDARKDVTVRWSTVKVNGPLTDATFARPEARPVKVRFADGATSTSWMGVELIEGRYVYLEGSLAGRKLPILLDSGADMSVVSTPIAAQLRLGKAGRVRLAGTTNAQAARFASGVDLQIGPVTLSDLKVLVTDLAGIEQAMGHPTPVVLGKEVFNALVVDIDYPGSRLALHDPASHQPPAQARLVPVLPGATRAVKVSVEGLPPAAFLLDTGSGGALTLFGAYTRQHRLLEGRSPRSQRLMRGLGGGSVVAVATLKKVALGGFELVNVPAEFHEGGEGAFDTKDFAGNLGAGLLQPFRVIFDFGRERLYLVAGPDWKPRPFRKNRVGMEADVRGDHLEVMFVAPGSPADRAAWRQGQRIRAIDGRAISADYVKTQGDWMFRAPGTQVMLTDGNGADRPLTLAEYY